MIRDMLELNHKTYSYNEIFQEIVNDDSPIDSSVHSNMDDGPDAKSTSWAHMYPVVTLAEQPVSQWVTAVLSFFGTVETLAIQHAQRRGMLVGTDANLFEAPIQQDIRDSGALGADEMAPQISALTSALIDIRGVESSEEKLMQCKQSIKQWLQQLVRFFCERSIHAFCFIENDTGRFMGGKSAEIESQTLQAVLANLARVESSFDQLSTEMAQVTVRRFADK